MSPLEDIDPEALWRILDVSRQLGANTDLGTILAQVVDAARDVLRAERGTVLLYDARAHELFATVATGADQIRFPAERGIAGQCARERRLINVPDCYTDPRFNPEIDRRTGYRTRCLMAIPLVGFDDALVGVMQVLNKVGGVFGPRDERIATVFAAQCAVALQRARLLEGVLRQQKLERDLALARDIQLRVLPADLPAVAGYDLAGSSRPADQTGGDIYDCVPRDDGSLMLLLGDATGHGIGPALSVTQVRAMFRMALRLGANLDQTFLHINHQLTDDLGGERFVTAFLGELDARAHRVRFHSGGQGPLFHYRQETHSCHLVDSTTLPLGILAEVLLDAPQCLDLALGDHLALITDGFFEYNNPTGEPFGHERLKATLASLAERPALEIVQGIYATVDDFAAGAPQVDDMTVMVVKRRR
jgi:phosphoserine phosphatase